MSRFPHDRDHPLLDPQSDRPLDILLLEDNEVDALVFEGTARRYSQPIHVRWTSTLKEFETALGERLPDIICADHLLPDGIATQALQVRNQVERDIPFLVITGAGEEDVAVDYMRLGASDYLSKRRLKEFGLVLDVLLRGYRNRALRHAAESESQRLNAELMALIRHTEEERDEEKRALSRDIHDQLGQELTALKLGMYMVQRGLNAEGGPDPTALSNKLDDLIALNTNVIQQVRNIARSLRPVVLDQVGLSAGIETLVRDFNHKGGTFCGLHMDPLPELNEAMRTDLFRIVQEALTNVQRHAEANLAYIRLFADDQALRLEIGDDGQGIPLQNEAEPAPMGIGVIGMRERVRNHGGEIRIQSTPGSGTAIEVTMPLGEAE
ncbi:MAG: response regulator [Crocinitomicaceae bacterium TMED114]|nr:MAG: response regulator [Crocinitomicaceae bacterium TMED114]